MWRLPSSPVGGTSRQMQHRKLCGSWYARVSLPEGSAKRKPSSLLFLTLQLLRFCHVPCSLHVHVALPVWNVPLPVELLYIPQGPTSRGASGKPATQGALCSISGYTGLEVTPLLLPGLGLQAGLHIPCIATPGPSPGPDSPQILPFLAQDAWSLPTVAG